MDKNACNFKWFDASDFTFLQEMSPDVYSSLMKALTMVDTADTSCYPVRVSAAGAISKLLEVGLNMWVIKWLYCKYNFILNLIFLGCISAE